LFSDLCELVSHYNVFINTKNIFGVLLQSLHKYKEYFWRVITVALRTTNVRRL